MRYCLTRLCVLLVAFSVLFTGISVGHAAGVHPGGKGHAALGLHGVHQQGPSQASTLHQQAECQEKTDVAGKTGTTKNNGTEGCCHIACFPSVAPRDFLDLSKHVFDANRFVSPYDETAASTDPEGRLRPPRLPV